MTGYVPESSVGWLDLDEAASERVAALLRSLEEPGTLDELGLGTVRDAFSELLSPGTSTVHTRLRYFIFLPWIFRRLERQRVAPADFAHRLREDEARLIDCLRHLGPNNGVIGYKAGRELQRMPSWLYWGGLGAWGLRRLNLTIHDYGQRVAALGALRPERDDDHNPTTRAASMWAPVPPPPDDFLGGKTTFELRAEEALFLIDSIRRHCPDTLLAALCAKPSAAAGAEFPWDVPSDGLAGRVTEVLRHARCFSELTLGPQLLYNVLVARKARDDLGWDTEKLEANQLRRLDKWVGLIVGRPDEWRSWAADPPAFWHVVGKPVGYATRHFVNFMAKRAVDDPAGFVKDPDVHHRIVGRELRLKSKRARLTYRSALENWARHPSGGQFDFRWGVTKRYLADIAAAQQAGA